MRWNIRPSTLGDCQWISFIDCIQPQESGETVFKAGGLDSVTIKCVRRLDCTANVTTIMTRDETVCTDYQKPSPPHCSTFPLVICQTTALNSSWILLILHVFQLDVTDDATRQLRTVTMMLKAPAKRGHTYAFCSTNDAFLSYEIDWDLAGSFMSHAFSPLFQPWQASTKSMSIPVLA